MMVLENIIISSISLHNGYHRLIHFPPQHPSSLPHVDMNLRTDMTLHLEFTQIPRLPTRRLSRLSETQPIALEELCCRSVPFSSSRMPRTGLYKIGFDELVAHELTKGTGGTYGTRSLERIEFSSANFVTMDNIILPTLLHHICLILSLLLSFEIRSNTERVLSKETTFRSPSIMPRSSPCHHFLHLAEDNTYYGTRNILEDCRSMTSS